MIKFCKVSLGKEEEKAVLETMRSGWIAAGPRTAQFEKEFARYVGVKHAIFTNSGTAALKMAYKYMKEELGVKMIQTPKNTFCATYSAAEEVGIESTVMAVYYKVNVHYGGVKDTDAGDQVHCYVEDSAHRIEPNDPLIGKIRIYSFYVTKNMTTGAGGMFVTDDDEIYERARLYWRDGINKSTYDRQKGGWDYTVECMAGGYDGNDIAASIGIEQLKKLPKFTEKRNQIRDLYNKAFNADWKGNHLYPYFVESLDEVASLIAFLEKGGVQASYFYPKTDWLGVSLPIYPDLKPEEQMQVIEEVQAWRKL